MDIIQFLILSDPVEVHTLFHDLDIRYPNCHLYVSPGRSAFQVSGTIGRLEQVTVQEQPDAALSAGSLQNGRFCASGNDSNTYAVRLI